MTPREANHLAMMLDALDGVVISDAERASLAWLAGFEAHTVEHITAMIARARAAAPPGGCSAATGCSTGGSGWNLA
ncbi:MAG: hypothetical protein ACRDSG_17300 [Pseudonocardiaceae bacterium]